MKLLTFLGTVILANATPVPEHCNGVTIANSPYLYEKEVLKTELDRPYLLVVDRNSNVLYFSYSAVDAEDLFYSAKIDLNDNDLKNITSVPNGFATTIDSTNNLIYIGGSDGIYKYDPKKDTSERYAAYDTNIWSLYYKNDLYYAEFPSQFLYVVKNGESIRVKDLENTKVDMFVIDEEDNIFYSNNSGIYSQKRGTKDAELYKEFGVLSARGLTTDKNGLVYACMDDGVYVVNKVAKRFDKTVDLEDAFGVAFDGDNNLVYSDANGVYRLKPNEKLYC